MARGRHSNLRRSVNQAKLNISVSPSTFRNLEQIAKQLKLSRSSLITKIAKGEINLSLDTTQTAIAYAPTSQIADANVSLLEKTESLDRSVSDNLISQELYAQLQKQLRSQQTTIEQLNQQLTQQQVTLEQDHQYQSLQEELATKNQQISRLEEQLKQIEQSKNSHKNSLISNLLLGLLLIALAALLIRFYYFGTTILN